MSSRQDWFLDLLMACRQHGLQNPLFLPWLCVPITARLSIQFACWVYAAFAQSLNVTGLGMVLLITAWARARFSPLLNRRIVPQESLSHWATSLRWSNVAMYVSRSSPCILMAKSFDSASSLQVVSVNTVLNALTNQTQRSWSSWLLTGGIGGMLFAFPLLEALSVLSLT